MTNTTIITTPYFFKHIEIFWNKRPLNSLRNDTPRFSRQNVARARTHTRTHTHTHFKTYLSWQKFPWKVDTTNHSAKVTLRIIYRIQGLMTKKSDNVLVIDLMPSMDTNVSVPILLHTASEALQPLKPNKRRLAVRQQKIVDALCSFLLIVKILTYYIIYCFNYLLFQLSIVSIIYCFNYLLFQWSIVSIIYCFNYLLFQLSIINYSPFNNNIFELSTRVVVITLLTLFLTPTRYI